MHVGWRSNLARIAVICEEISLEIEVLLGILDVREASIWPQICHFPREFHYLSKGQTHKKGAKEGQQKELKKRLRNPWK